METKFHLRVRAVIYRDGHFLAVRTKNGSHSFLPGGHIETGESAIVALKREMMEECGRQCDVKEYLGAIENAWIEGGVKQWEITHFFHTEIHDLEKNPNIVPHEEGFDILWVETSEFEKLNFLPVPLRNIMEAWASGERKTWWASAM